MFWPTIVFLFKEQVTTSKLSLVICTLLFGGCVLSRSPEQKTARLLQRGKIREDTSWVYSLPYEKGISHLLVQGYYSAFSHRHRAALDFKMKQGTKIFAARGGIVIRLQEQNSKGGGNKKYRKFANFVVLEHEDGSKAGYWHLQQNGVLVNIGDTVKQGQLIALSGKTGNAAFAHLHFIAWTNKNAQWQAIPTRFMTSKGPRYLRPLRKWHY